MQLEGIRVVDLSRILSGPFCSMFLADMGAEVIKIEGPDDGDPVRKQGILRNGFSLYFASFNRNKRSITLNLRTAEGKEVLLDARGPVENTLQDILGGVRSACTYVGANKLKELSKRTTFVRVTQQLNEVFGKS